jgi:curved DNA-binding protein CbpA
VNTRRPTIPRLVAEIDVRTLPLTSVEGFVVSRIDGALTVQDLADLTNLQLSEMERIVAKLVDLKVAEWADGTVSLPRAAPGAVAATPAPRRSSVFPRTPEPRRSIIESQAPSAIREPVIPRGRVVVPRPSDLERETSRDSTETNAAPPPRPPPFEKTQAADVETKSPSSGSNEIPVEIDLPLERRQRIDELYPVVELMNHYELLGLDTSADVKMVRARYFELSKVFHPDTAFRRNLGGYKAKMEAIFTRLTEAYEVLGKKKSRAEYDAYLELQGDFRAVEAALRETPLPPEPSFPPPNLDPPSNPPVTTGRLQSSAPARPSSPARASSAPARASSPPASSGPPPAGRIMSDEGRRRARELLERRLGGARTLGAQKKMGATSSPRPPPRAKEEIVRDLAHTLKSAAALTGGLDPVQRHALEARRREQSGDLAGAARELRFALALAPDRADMQVDYERVSAALARALADKYMQAAEYEERHKKWAAAAASWCKVVDGRPEDAEAAVRAAVAFVEAKGDLHRAQKLAQQAIELRPDWLFARITLGRVFLAAGLHLNARRELERAVALDPTDQTVKDLLRDLKP